MIISFNEELNDALYRHVKSKKAQRRKNFTTKKKNDSLYKVTMVLGVSANINFSHFVYICHNTPIIEDYIPILNKGYNAIYGE